MTTNQQTGTAVDYFNIMPSNKSQILDFAQQIKNAILSGSLPTVYAFTQLKALKSLAEVLLQDKDCQDVLLQQLDVNEVLETSSVKITKRSSSIYEFNDSTLNDLENALQNIEQAIKDRKELLKKLPEPVIIEETGEVVNPAKFTGTNVSVVITLKK